MPAELSFKQRFFQLYRSVLKQNLKLVILITAVTVLCFPIPSGIEMYKNYEEIHKNYVQEFLGSYSGTHYTVRGAANLCSVFSSMYLFLYTLAAPVLMVCILCRPLHSKRAADLFYSLPLSRRGILWVWAAAGMTMTAIPILIGFICTFLAARIIGYSSELVPASMVVWDFFLFLLTAFSIMSIVLLCAVCAGNTFDCLVFYVSAMVLPSFSSIVLAYMADRFANGCASNLFMGIGFTLVPLLGWFNHIRWDRGSLMTITFDGSWAGVPSIIIMTAAGCILFAVSLWYVRRRKSEISGTTKHNPCFQYFICSLAAIGGGSLLGLLLTDLCSLFLHLFSGTEVNQWIWMFLISTIGGAVVFVVAEAFFRRGPLNLKKQMAHAGIALAGMAAVSGGVLFYSEVILEDYIPDISQIESVELTWNPGVYSGLSKLRTANSRGKPGYYVDPIITSEENIRQFCEIHKLIIDDFNKISRKGDGDPKYKHDLIIFGFTYHLKGGKQVDRHYTFKNGDIADAIVEKLCSSEEYIRQSIPLFNPDYEEYIQELSLWDGLALREEAFPNQQQDSEKYRRLLAVLSREFIAMDPSVYFNETETPIAWLSYSYPEQGYYEEGDIIECSGEVPIYASFEKTVSLMKEFGYGDLLENDFSMVERVIVTSEIGSGDWTEVHGKMMVVFENGRNISDMNSWIDQTVEDSEVFMTELPKERIINLIPRMRLGINRPTKDGRYVIICTKDRYTIRVLEDK